MGTLTVSVLNCKCFPSPNDMRSAYKWIACVVISLMAGHSVTHIGECAVNAIRTP